ncbi:MAG: phospholipase [Gammaproteobacteria bacterium]|nr:MAG: phospholipase [Gammaproteobacteria bacterium]
MRNFLFGIGLLGATASIFSNTLSAEEAAPISEEEMRLCMEKSVLTADKSMTIRNLQEACAILLSQSTTSDSEKSEQQVAEAESKVIKGTDIQRSPRMLNDRGLVEALNRSNRFVLTPHKRNYILPLSYSDSPNTDPYKNSVSNDEADEGFAFSDLKHAEFEFQLSIKILIRENIFDDNGHLYLGYTNHSLWQVYNRETSAPFRETNHQPELLLTFTNDFEIFGFRNVLNEFSINHQSNGQSGVLSRSWNRVMFNSVFEGENFSFSLNPWYRLPEDKSRYPGDPKGDDNPDIDYYMGNFQFSGAYRYKANIFSLELRNNLKINSRGAAEVAWTFPISSTMRGYVNYFDGYGHSLIDYNDKQRVVGLGITFTDLF